MHSCVTVWCGFWAGGIIHTFLKTRLVKQLMVLDITRSFCWNWMILMWPICGFNKTVPHAVQWNDSITARDISWSCTLSFKCGLTPLDFFLWGYSKSKIYINNHTCITRGNWTLHQRNSVTIVQKSDEKFGKICQLKTKYLKTLFYIQFKSCVNFGTPFIIKIRTI